MNKTIISGRLTADVVARKAGIKESSVANYTIAVPRGSGKDAPTDFVNVVTWGHDADFLGNYAKKGCWIEVVGSLQSDTYEKDGKKVYTLKVVTDMQNGSVRIVSYPKGATNNVGSESGESRGEEIALTGADTLPF